MMSLENNEVEDTSLPPLDNGLPLDSPSTKRQLSPVALLLQAGFVLTGILWLGSLGSKVALASLKETGTSTWNDAYDRTQLIHFLTMTLSGLTLALLIWWTTRAYRNLDITGRASENPLQVLVSWFIPIVNLLIPARAIEELSVGGRPDEQEKTQPRLVWYFWLTGPAMFWVRLALLQLEPLVFPSGTLSTVFTGLEWATNISIASACFVGAFVVRKTTALAQLW